MESKVMRLDAYQSFQGQDLRHLIEESKQNCSRREPSSEVTVRMEREIQGVQEKLEQALSEMNQSDTLALSKLELLESQ